MSKIKILIADDDTMVRIGLKSIINWDENGFVLVGEASDGASALELAQKTDPDIIITDMKMPRMDGLELMKALKENRSRAEIIVLSSYDEFSLVKQAMKLGARDYLLKLNLDPKEFVQSIQSVAERIEESCMRTDTSDSEHNLSLLRKDFLWQIISNVFMEDNQRERSVADLDIHLSQRPVYAAILKIGELFRFEEASSEEIQTLRFSVMNIAEEIISDIAEGYCVPGKTGEFFILFSCRETMDKIKKECFRLRRMLEEYLNLSSTILLGYSTKDGIQGIQESVIRANEVLGYRFYLDHEGVLSWKEDIHKTRQDTYDLADIKNALHDILIFGSPDELDSILQQLEQDIDRLRLSKSVIQSIAIEIFYVVQDYFAGNMLPIESSLPNSFRSYEQLLHMESLKAFYNWIHLLQEDLKQFMKREEEKGYSQIIGKVMNWIALNYRESASLQEAAYAAGFNPSYLSSLLKKHTGKSYTEQLTTYRIEQAKEILLSTDLKIYQVGEMVGYDDKYYFNRIFKRETGMTPGEFKKQKREG
ncbi:MAG: response regulator [Lachnospiraceae bacterium]|nr:response regulator [Lachnospiraceae bacterium]